jgi:hypothetical protein
MSNRNQSDVASGVATEQSLQELETRPDPSWRGLYKAGGISVFASILTGLVVPAILFIPRVYERGMDGASLLTLISQNQLWWIVLQTLTLGVGSFFAIVTFMAVFVSLKHVNKSYAAIGAALAIACQLLFVAYYPVTLGIAYLGEQYVTATAERQASLGTAAVGLMSMLDAFNPLYESVLAISVLILSLVMLRGVFHKGVAYLGFATTASAFIGLSLWPLVGIGYFWWWLLLVIWLIAVGWRLYRLSSV